MSDYFNSGKRKDGLGGADRVSKHVSKLASLEEFCRRNHLSSGTLPKPRNQAERDACENDLPRFLRHYFPSIYTRPFAPAAIQYLKDVADGIARGGEKCVAVMRGWGKTALAVGALTWAALYGKRRYLALIAATGELAERLVKDTVAYLTTEEIVADFPEVGIPLLAIEGRAQRCASQTYKGVLTKLVTKTSLLVLPTIPNSKASGVVVQSAGLTGSIRGMHYADEKGQWVRPDFVLLDDPQTNESAKSVSQTDTREELILSDVLGLAGHDKEIAAVMAVTVIEKNDLADRFLSAERHGEWRGQRVGIINGWQEDADERWREYDEVRGQENRGEVEPGSANKVYEANRAKLDEGIVPADEHFYAKDEVSAIQHARNLLLSRGVNAFQAEYMQEPVSRTADAPYTLDEEDVLKKMSGTGRGAIPADAKKVVAAIDVNRYALSWCVTALRSNGTLSILDYGWWTPKGKDCVWPENSTQAGDLISKGITTLVSQICGHRQYGEEVATIAVDSNYETQVVRNLMPELQRLYQHRRVVAARALAGKDYKLPTDRATRFLDGLEADLRWAKGNRRAVECYWDSTYWHIRTQKGWLMPPGADGSTELYKAARSLHRRFAEQAVADRLCRVDLTSSGRQVAVWTTNSHNEMGDVVALSGALASLGEKLVDVSSVQRAKTAKTPVENGEKEAVETPKPRPKRRIMMPGWH